MIAKISRLRTVVMGLALMSLVALISMTVTTSAQVEATVPQPLGIETIPCPMTLPEGDVDGETIVCGQIKVPENWDNPSGRTLLITYAITKAENEAPFSDPIVFFEGGPGISALEEIEALDANSMRLRATRDIIYFDQRGIRYSAPLECPSEIRSIEPDIEIPEDVDPEELAATLGNITLDSDVDAVLEANEIVGPNSTVANCTPYFAEQGVDLSQYGSYTNALDAIALMDALDYPSYNLYGISYGSNHVMEVMRYYDENDAAELPAIRSILIDGVIGSWVDLIYNNAIAHQIVILDVFEACEADEACSASYPNIRQRAIDLLDAVEAAPLVIDESTTITIDDLTAVLTSNGPDPAGLVYLPRMIDELERGEAEVYLRLQEGTLPVTSESGLPQVRNPFDPISLEANDLASQMRILAQEVENLAAQSRRLSEAYDRGIPLPQFFADELVDSAEQLPTSEKGSFLLQLGTIANSSPDRDQLLQTVSYLPEAERNLLVSLIGLMNDDDIAEAYAILSDPLYSERLTLTFLIPQDVIHCNDRVFDMNNTFEALRASDAPQLVTSEQLDVGFVTRCAGYGLSGSPTEPIVNSSGFPVFVSNGALDVATAVLWGEQVFENLENARMVTFPNSGHGATRKSDCARDIANAFFMYPEDEFSDACVETLRPVFVMPDDELPE